MPRVSSMRIAVLGGGPGGLFVAMLAKASDPSRDVTVFERNRAEDTFGFGVVFSDSTLAGIDEATQCCTRALAEHGVHWDTIGRAAEGRAVQLRRQRNGGCERRTLLQLLQRRGGRGRVELRFSTEVDPDDVLGDGFDLVIGRRRGELTVARAVFRTCPTRSVKTATEGSSGSVRRTRSKASRSCTNGSEHGVFAVHGYPIGGGVSTFIVETDEDSWRSRARRVRCRTARRRLVTRRAARIWRQLFAEHLEGHRLLVNNALGRLPNPPVERWHHRARRTGRRACSVTRPVPPTSRLGPAPRWPWKTRWLSWPRWTPTLPMSTPRSPTYQEGPAAAGCQDPGFGSTEPSWREHFGRSYDALSPWQFAYHFFTRALTDGRLRRRDPTFVANTRGTLDRPAGQLLRWRVCWRPG